MILTKFDSDEAWKSHRSLGIGASDVAAAHSGYYGGAYAAVAQRLDLIEVEVTPQMQRGHDWEDRLSDAVSALTGWVVVGEQMGAVHDDNPVWRCTPDGLLAPHDHATLDDIVAGLELKTFGSDTKPSYPYYRIQCQYQALVMGVKAVVLAVAEIDDATGTCTDLHLEVVEADPYMQMVLGDLAMEMWAHVQAGTLPQPDAPSALDVAKELNAELDPDAEPVDLSDLAADIARFHLIKDRLASVKDELKLLEARIRDAVGHAPGGECDGFKVTVAKPRRVLTDEGEAKLMKLFPHLVVRSLDKTACKAYDTAAYEAHQSPVGARTLTVKAA